jgi:hypothetical protein
MSRNGRIGARWNTPAFVIFLDGVNVHGENSRAVVGEEAAMGRPNDLGSGRYRKNQCVRPHIGATVALASIQMENRNINKGTIRPLTPSP